MKRGILVAVGLAGLVATAAVLAATGGNARKVAMPMLHPSINDYQQLTSE